MESEEQEKPVTQLNLQELLSALQLPEDQVLNVYQIGSRVWGTSTERSDWDFVIVMDKNWIKSDGETLIQVPSIDAAVFNCYLFEEALYRWHILYIVACLSLPSKHIWLEKKKFYFDEKNPFSVAQLRSTVSKECSRTWVKAKKKIEIESNPELGKKDLIHTFRDLLFAIQIVEKGKIEDFAEANSIYYEVKENTSIQWKDYHEQFKKRYNELCSKLRNLVKKEDIKPFEGFLFNPKNENELERFKSQKKIKWKEKEDTGIKKLTKKEEDKKNELIIQVIREKLNFLVKKLIDNKEITLINNKSFEDLQDKILDFSLLKTRVGKTKKLRKEKGDFYCNICLRLLYLIDKTSFENPVELAKFISKHFEQDYGEISSEFENILKVIPFKISMLLENQEQYAYTDSIFCRPSQGFINFYLGSEEITL